MTADLVQFVRDRLDEQEEDIRALPAGPWEWKTIGEPGDPEWDGLMGQDDTPLLASGDAEGWMSGISRHEAFDAYLQDIQPARALADIEAKRQLLEALLSEGHAVLRPGGSTQIYCDADYGADGCCDCGRDERLDRLIRLLALPYADHPDYRQEWRP
ncbi:DUF6221 family protein [Streptomyces sp. ASQP_92]|uniref:DUF6221 family protein n=1 Tax=Streptomyces sp. ASQP_92 TaxID=2979116 RepID=UPI0021BEDE2C|nr:DUF6221 family protein [Streptomyces sp. ASQP_92]MCT9092864.1 DUF6221 family protein [Streptomyces sp. ASQP_92]